MTRGRNAEQGFLLIEVTVAMVVFLIVATALVGLLVSSTSLTTVAKERTVAEQGVSSQIEKIRAMDYALVGTTNGNPTGSISSSVAFTGVNGESIGVGATMQTAVTYVGVNVPGAVQTGADAKKVIVTIRRTSDSKILARATTIVAPKLQASQTTGTVQATVVDIGDNTDLQNPNGQALQNVRVTLTPPNGLNPPIPSGPESDVTDAGGQVVFASLSPTSGSQTYSLGIAVTDVPLLYTQIAVTPFAISPTEILPETIQVYQPVVLNVALRKQDGSNYVGTATITVTDTATSTSHTFSNVAFAASGAPYQITTLSPPSGQLLLPNHDYSITVQANGYSPVTDHAVVPVAGSYPASSSATLTQTFTETLTKLVAPPAELDVLVQETRRFFGTTLTCRNASVTVSGGPLGALYTTYTGNTGTTSPFKAVFANPPNTNIVANTAPYDTTPYSVTATAADGKSLANNNVTLTTNPYTLTINVGTTSSSSC